jgi:glycosyltransferase EpsH
MSPKVSIIIPVYNTEKYLDKCLESVCGQTLKEIEIIVVNDGSTDESQSIIDKFARKDKRIKVVIKENGGLSSARNAGLEVAEGVYVGYVDSDDWIDEEMYEELYRIAVRDDSDIAVCGCRDVFTERTIETSHELREETLSVKEMGLEKFFIDKRKKLTIITCNKIYRTSIIKEYNIRYQPNKEIYSEDLLFNLYYQLHCDKITSTSRSFYNYYIRQGSISHSQKPELIIQLIRLVEYFKNYAKAQGKLEEVKNFLPLLMCEMMNKALVDVYKWDNNSFRASREILDIAHSSAFYRELTRGILGGNYDIKEKIKVALYKLRPHWAGAGLLWLIYSIRYSNNENNG